MDSIWLWLFPSTSIASFISWPKLLSLVLKYTFRIDNVRTVVKCTPFVYSEMFLQVLWRLIVPKDLALPDTYWCCPDPRETVVISKSGNC
jgi:hypothetical protein